MTIKWGEWRWKTNCIIVFEDLLSLSSFSHFMNVISSLSSLWRTVGEDSRWISSFSAKETHTLRSFLFLCDTISFWHGIDFSVPSSRTRDGHDGKKNIDSQHFETEKRRPVWTMSASSLCSYLLSFLAWVSPLLYSFIGRGSFCSSSRRWGDENGWGKEDETLLRWRVDIRLAEEMMTRQILSHSLSMNERRCLWEEKDIDLRGMFSSYFAWTRFPFSFSQVRRGVHLIIPVLTRERRKTCMKWKRRHNSEKEIHDGLDGWRVDNNCHRRLSPFHLTPSPFFSFHPIIMIIFMSGKRYMPFLSHTNVSLLCVSDLSRRLISASLWGRFPLCPFPLTSPT